MTGRELINLLKKERWVIERIRGSHYILGKGNETLVIPVHGKREVPKGTLNNILKKAGFK